MKSLVLSFVRHVNSLAMASIAGIGCSIPDSSETYALRIISVVRCTDTDSVISARFEGYREPV